MSVNLLALCRHGGDYQVKRVQVTAQVQSLLEGIFTQQEQEFFDGITEEVPFDGGWRPERDELLDVDAPPEATAVLAAAQSNLVSLPDVDAAHFTSEGIRGLCVLMGRPGGDRLLIQNFSARQLLEQKFSLILDGDTFNRLSQPAFSIGSSLAGVIEGDRLKFNSFNNIRMIFDLKNLYQEASDSQLDGFMEHSAFHVADAAALKKVADQQIRKLVHAISERGILDVYTVAHIVATAASEGIVIAQQDGKSVLPSTRAEIKELLHFLDDAFYRAALSGDAYISNSKKRIYRAAA
jgi:hypothetical protein